MPFPISLTSRPWALLTGTVLAAWLVREGLTADEALRRVRLIDAQYVQSQAQEDLLYAYEVALLLKMG